VYPSVNLSGFAPNELLQKVGGLGGAKVLAARAHAMFDVGNKYKVEHATPDFTVSPFERSGLSGNFVDRTYFRS
jgi:hypothetical protein